MAAIAPDTVQDIVFGATAIIGGVEIILAAVKKQIASALSFAVTAFGIYGTFDL